MIRSWPEAIVDGVVDDVDARFGHAEVAQDVALRRLRDRDHARRAVGRRPHLRPGVRVSQLARQVLGKPQVNAVVDGDDAAARRQRRQYVMRRMEELGPDAAERRRQRELLRDGIRVGRLGDRPEPRSQFFDRVAVVLAAKDDVLVRRILPPELAQQVAHVRADAVVAKLAAVDGYAHLRVEVYSLQFTVHSSQLTFPFDAEVQAKKRRVDGVMLFVERHLTCPVGFSAGGGL